MHLIISIALGIFAGLWLFVKWGEWREARWERKQLRRLRRAGRQAELAREAAERQAKPAARVPLILTPYRVTAGFVGSLAVLYIADVLLR